MYLIKEGDFEVIKRLKVDHFAAEKQGDLSKAELDPLTFLTEKHSHLKPKDNQVKVEYCLEEKVVDLLGEEEVTENFISPRKVQVLNSKAKQDPVKVSEIPFMLLNKG